MKTLIAFLAAITLLSSSRVAPSKAQSKPITLLLVVDRSASSLEGAKLKLAVTTAFTSAGRYLQTGVDQLLIIGLCRYVEPLFSGFKPARLSQLQAVYKAATTVCPAKGTAFFEMFSLVSRQIRYAQTERVYVLIITDGQLGDDPSRKPLLPIAKQIAAQSKLAHMMVAGTRTDQYGGTLRMMQALDPVAVLGKLKVVSLESVSSGIADFAQLLRKR